MAIIYTYPVKATPNDNDLILISDSEDSNNTKQVKISTLPGGSGSGVSSVTATSPVVSSGGSTPAISLTGLTGFGTTGQVIKVNSNADGLEWGTAGTTLPGGNNNNIQYKNGTAFAGSDDLSFSSNELSVKHTIIAKGQGGLLPAGRLKLNCEQDSHAITLEGPAHSGGANYTLKFPSAAPVNNQILEYTTSGSLGWINTPSGSGGVSTFTNAFGTFITGTANSTATGAVDMGTINLSATGTASSTTFLRGDNTWDVPAGTTYSAGTGLGLSGTVFSLASGAALTNLGGGSGTTTFLRKDGTFATPPGSGVSETSGIWYATLANSSGQSYASNATQAQITITTNNCQWKRIGNIVHYQFYIAGTIKGTDGEGAGGILQGKLFLCQTGTGGATSSTTYGLPINSTLGNTLVDDGFCNGSLVMTETEAPQQALTWAYPVNGGRIGRDTSYPGYVELCSLLNSGTASKLYYPNSAVVWITNTSEANGNWALGGTLSAMVTHD